MHGMCRPAVQRHAEHERDGAAVAVAERPPDERLTDADRQDAADLLGAAFRDGVIRIEELDERLSAALGAQVASDLVTVTGDLPAQWLADRQAAAAAARRAEKHRRRWSAEVRTYVRVMVLLVGIWLVTSLAAGELRYPWPIWPAVGWGIPLFLSRPTGPAARTVRHLRAAREY